MSTYPGITLLPCPALLKDAIVAPRGEAVPGAEFPRPGDGLYRPAAPRGGRSNPPKAKPPGTRGRATDHLIAAGIVAAAAIALALLVEGRAVRLERRNAAAMAPESMHQRDAGVALARADFSAGDILPVYGSSELERPLQNLAPDFFRDAPTGFRACPMGRRGTMSLPLLEKAAAAGEAGAGCKVVVLVSQYWFLESGPRLPAYAGNFSVLQAMELIFKAPLSAGLRRDIARRMLNFPTTLKETPVLDAGVRAAARIDTAAGRSAYAAVRPLGLLETRVLEMQDHFESARRALESTASSEPVSMPAASPDWERLIREADAVSPTPHEVTTPARYRGDLDSTWRSVNRMPTCAEWGDLELLLRTFKELHMQPLLLDIPWCAAFYDDKGVNAGIRGQYYGMLRSLAGKYGVPVALFQDHEYDANFLSDHRSHLSPKGWAYFDRDIDAYWHGQPLPYL